MSSITDTAIRRTTLPRVTAGLCTKCGEVLASRWDCGCGRIGDHPLHQPVDTTPDLSEAADMDLCLTLLGKYLGELNPRESLVLGMRYGIDGYGESKTPLTLEEVGTALGTTRDRVKGIQETALKNLSRAFTAGGYKWESA